MQIIRSHKIQLQPNEATARHFARAAGCARQAYNWAVARTKEMLANGEKPTDKTLKAEFNRIKREQFPFQLEVTKCAAEGAFRSFAKARKRFFEKRARFPTFHKKGRRDSFAVNNDKFRVDGKYVFLPKIGRVKMTEVLRFEGKIMSGVVSRTAGRWFISIAVQFETEPAPARETQAVGADLGIKHLAVLSTGEKVEGPKALGKHLRRLQRAQRKLSRRQKGSRRRWRQRMRVARLYYRIACIRNDGLHKLTARLVDEFTHIGVEDLNVSGMVRNHRLARRIADQSFSEFRRQLEYKAETRGTVIHVVDRFFPSSKLCHVCDYKNDELTLKDREWICPHCGNRHDRDVNAALNLLGQALSEVTLGDIGVVVPVGEPRTLTATIPDAVRNC